MIKRPIQLSHDFLEEVLDKEAVALDATMGNGYDTVFLAQHAKTVYAFDIQKQALLATREKLSQAGVANAQLILDGHENLDAYIEQPLRAVIFNLGYLPSADKTIITQPKTTLLALEKALERLEIGGRISLMIYYGHEGGDLEKDAVLQFVKDLSQDCFATMLYQPLNQVNTPPFLIMIERLKGETTDVNRY